MIEGRARFKHIRAVVLDWAGTAVDFGSIAPTTAFIRAFGDFGISVWPSEVRAFMGLGKRDHTKAILRLESVRANWTATRGRDPAEGDVDELHAAVEAILGVVAIERARPVPGLLELISELRAAGVGIGSSTAYSAALMEGLIEAAARLGYTADFVACPRPGMAGRPAPWMMFECAKALGVFPMSAIVKIGDTAADMEEARNAGAWAIGLSMSGNECGLDLEEFLALDPDQAGYIRKAATARLSKAGADIVVDGIWNCLEALERIDALMDEGIAPETRGAEASSSIPDNPYILLAPGALSASKVVRAEMLRDWCT